MSAPAASGRLDSRPSPSPTGPPLLPGVHPLDGIGLRDTLVVVPPSPSPRLLVFFHGAGGDARSGLPLLQEAAAGHGVVLLLPGSAASTWDLLTGRLGRDVAALDAALEHCFERMPVERVALSGFSDGGSYALSLGLANGDLAPDLLAFSPGFLAPPAQVGTPRVWLSHGTDDRVLPVDRCGRRVARTLGDAGYDVRYEEFDGGHVVRPELVEAGLRWWLGG